MIVSIASSTHTELLQLTARAQAFVPKWPRVVAPAGSGVEDIVPIDLGPTTPDLDSASLQRLGALYLAACFEAAGVIPAAEALTRLVRTGVVRGNLGNALRLVQDFWRTREERASESERRALFSDLFGVPSDVQQSGRAPNQEFEELLLDFCEAVYRVAQSTGGSFIEIPRLRRAAQRLLQNLERAGSSMAIMMADDILSAQRTALQLLHDDGVRAALHARDVWEAIDNIDALLRRPSSPRQPHIDRGRAGLTLLGWLAGNAQLVTGSRPFTITPDDQVVTAAIDWLEASLRLGEAGASGEPAGTPPRPGPLAELPTAMAPG
jgi:hypothetical protein